MNAEKIKRPKTGGRKKGVPNRMTAAKEGFLQCLEASADPFMFWAGILKDQEVPLALRARAAEILLPYTRPKLASIEMSSATKSHEERLAELAKLMGD